MSQIRKCPETRESNVRLGTELGEESNEKISLSIRNTNPDEGFATTVCIEDAAGRDVFSRRLYLDPGQTRRVPDAPRGDVLKLTVSGLDGQSHTHTVAIDGASQLRLVIDAEGRILADREV